MNLKHWICPNCDKKNIDDSNGLKFRCAKCGKVFLYNEIEFFDDDDDISDKEYPYE